MHWQIRKQRYELLFKNVIAYKMLCCILFMTCLMYFGGTFAHAKASHDVFPSMFRHDVRVPLNSFHQRCRLKLITLLKPLYTSMYAFEVKARMYLHNKCFINQDRCNKACSNRTFCNAVLRAAIMWTKFLAILFCSKASNNFNL